MSLPWNGCQTTDVGNHRKQVTVCGATDAFVGALRHVLGEFTVVNVESPSETPADSDILIYQPHGRLEVDSLSGSASRVPTLVLGEPNQLIDSVEASCRGFLPNTAPLEEVRSAVNTILAGGSVVPPDLLGSVLRHLVDRRREELSHLDLQELTDREREVFRLAAEGARKDEIGQRLFISPDTARTHLQRVYRKLGVHSQAELIALAARDTRARGDDP